jgi:hypothetical protein
MTETLQPDTTGMLARVGTEAVTALRLCTLGHHARARAVPVT